jgi:predicted lactoylglutathione lyase
MKAIINTPTPDLQQSKDFYHSLRYHLVESGDHHYAISGDLIIRINPDRYSRPGLVFYQEDWGKIIDSFKEDYYLINKDHSQFVAAPSGTIVELCQIDHYPDLPGFEEVNELPGKFSGISIEAFDFKKSVSFWSSLGYNINAGNVEGGWVSMGNESQIGISIMKFHMCPHLFYNPSFTYFNSGNNIEVIKSIKDAQIPITEEITFFNKEGIVDNIIIRDPGGFGFFIFND